MVENIEIGDNVYWEVGARFEDTWHGGTVLGIHKGIAKISNPNKPGVTRLVPINNLKKVSK